MPLLELVMVCDAQPAFDSRIQPPLRSIRRRLRLRGRERRSVNVSTKLREVEAKVVEDAAVRAGKTPREWSAKSCSVPIRPVHRNGPAHF